MENFLNPEVLKEEVTRKQFLRYALGLIVAVVGISNLIANIQKWKQSPSSVTKEPVAKSKGFGSSKFGV